MKNNRGIKKFIALLLLGSLVFSNIALYKDSMPKERSAYLYEVRSQIPNKFYGLDVGKAD